MKYNPFTRKSGASPREYLEARLDMSDPNGCWEWTTARFYFGHGQFKHTGLWPSAMAASRAAWMIYRGDPGKLHVLHRCDNPPCCNPDHLFLGTPMDNKEDARQKGRHSHGMRQPKSKLVDVDILEIRLLHERKWLGRTAIARAYSVSKGLIDMILAGKIWTHVRA